MPANINFASNPMTTRRRRTASPGALNLTGVEQGLNATVAALQPDLQAEQDARLSDIERNLAETRAQLGRQFALTPGGTTTPGLQGGEQQRAFEQLELGGLSLKDQLRADIAARTPAEQRANISALAGLQNQSFTQGLNLSGLDLQRRQQAEAERANKAQEGLQAGNLVGTYEGQQTLANRAQAEAERAQKAQEALQAGSLVGSYGGQQTLAGRETSLREAEGLDVTGANTVAGANAAAQRAATTRQLELAEAAQSDDANIRNRALDLQGEIQRGTLSIDQANQILNEEIQRGQLGLAQQAQDFTQAAEIARQTGTFTNPETGEVLDTLEKTNQAFQQEIQTAAQTGDLNGITTLAARELAFREGESVGVVRDQQTLAARALKLQGDIQRGQLALQEQAQTFGQQVTEAELTGLYDKMGNEFGAFQAAFNAQSGDANYNSRYDFDGNGNVDFDDFLQFTAIANNEAVQTLEAQALQEQKLLREFNEKVTKAGLLGTFEDQRIVQEKQRLFENEIAEAQLFVDTPPVSISWDDFTKAFNSSQGDAKYKSHLDLNDDGTINFNDYIQLIDSERMSVVSGSLEDPINSGLVMSYRPPGKTTVISAQLGLEEKKLSEATRQFNEQQQVRTQEFLTQMSGYLVDENGDFAGVIDPATGEVVTGNTLDREKFRQSQNEFNKQMQVNVEQFLEQLGLQKDALKNEKDATKLAALSQVIAAAFGAVGQIRASGNSVFGGGTSSGSTSLPFLSPTVSVGSTQTGNTGGISFPFGS